MKSKNKVQIEWVAGIDEVGRGPIAGPVTVCLFITKVNFDVLSIFPFKTIRDSKKTKKAIRISINKTIKNLRKFKSNEINYFITSKSATYIDKYGISKAVDECINQNILKLKKANFSLESTSFYLDGSLKIKTENLQQETIIKGDEKHAHIALASILAKEFRDSYMSRKHASNPKYGWDLNVGYGTKFHYESIKKYGTTKEHRLKFIY
jgi:ribonuclease HII